MHAVALAVAITAAAAIIVLGIRFILSPTKSTLDFGVASDNVRALTAIKGVRDITSGAVVLAVWAGAGSEAMGWALTFASLTAIGDAVIVSTNGGSLSKALGMHGITAALLIAAGLVLALG